MQSRLVHPRLPHPIAFAVLLAIGIPAALAQPSQPATAREFSFLHLSDSHVSTHFEMPDSLDRQRSYDCIRTLKDLGPISMEPYGVTAPAPSFLLLTGDITEYGFAGVTWNVVDAYFKGVKFPYYLVPGNHGNTWVATPQEFRRRYGGTSYSFNHEGCHFIALCTATLQDPVQSIGEEVIRFLKNDLETVDPATPVFVFFHHPFSPRSYSSRYDFDRVLDAVRGHNVVLMLDGHGHAAVHHDFWGIDGVEGGSPFSRQPGREGYNVIYVKGDRLFVGYRSCEAPHTIKPLLEKTIPDRAPFPRITVQSPTRNQQVKGTTLPVSAKFEDTDRRLASAYYELDDEHSGDLKTTDGKSASGQIDLSRIGNGAHFVRINLVDDAGTTFSNSIAFFSEPSSTASQGHALWRFPMGGASKTMPLLCNESVYAGSNDGRLYALSANNGELKWSFDAGAEILSDPVAVEDVIVFATGAGKIYGLTPEGKVKWTYEAQGPVFSSPTVAEGVLYIGSNAAELIALQASDGKPLWVNRDAQYSIESQPAAANGRVYFGAWDGYLYCADAKTGKTLWKKPGPKNQEDVNRYYAPADNGPAIDREGNVYVADRGYVAGKYAPDGTYVKTLSEDAWALGLAGDGKSIYLRGSKTPITKTDTDGNSLWTSDVVAGRIPISPTEKNGRVYVCTNTGSLHVLDAATGKTLWQYQVTPQLYVMSGVAVENGVAYTTGMDGFVTAVKGP